jgi:hypothetical protein
VKLALALLVCVGLVAVGAKAAATGDAGGAALCVGWALLASATRP